MRVVDVSGRWVTLSVGAEDGATVLVRLGDETIGSSVAGSGPTDLRVELPEGRSRLLVAAVDRSGNESVSSRLWVTIDTTPPAPAKIRIARVAAPDDPWTTLSVRGEKDARVDLTFTSVERVFRETTLLPRGSGELAVLLGDGEWVVDAVLSDRAGNQATSSTDLLIDVPAPVRPVVDVPEVTADNRPELALQGPPLGRVTLHVGDRSLEVVLDEKGKGLASVTDALRDGTYAVVGWSVDFQGQQSVASDEVSLTIDTTAPDLDVVAGRGSYTVTSEPGVGIAVSSAAFTDAFTAASATTTRPWALGVGSHAVEVVATDAAGNETTRTLEVEVADVAAMAVVATVVVVTAATGSVVWRRRIRSRDSTSS